MSAATLYDTGAPTIEVRIYRDHELLMRVLCESEDDASEVVDRWSDVANLFVIADDLATMHGPGDVLAREAPIDDPTDEASIATAVVPARGVE